MFTFFDFFNFCVLFSVFTLKKLFTSLLFKDHKEKGKANKVKGTHTKSTDPKEMECCYCGKKGHKKSDCLRRKADLEKAKAEGRPELGALAGLFGRFLGVRARKTVIAKEDPDRAGEERENLEMWVHRAQHAHVDNVKRRGSRRC